MKTKSKRILAVVLATALLLGMFAGLFSMKAGALNLSQAHEVSWDHVLTDENNNTFTWYTGLTAANNPYGYALPAQQRSMHDYTVKRLGLTGNSNDWTYNQDFVYAFCIEHGVPITDKTSYRGSASETHGNKWEAMSASQRKLIQLALTYGYPNYGDVQTAKDANACYAATQLIVWQISFNFRTSATALNDRTYPMSGHSGTMTQQLTANAHLKRYYDAILSAMDKHYTIPSFSGGALSSAPTYALNYVGGQYTLTLTDTNGILSQFYVINQGGVGYTISGNTMTITSPVPFGNVAEITLGKRLPQTGGTTGFLIWAVPGKEGQNQDMVTGVAHDPVHAYIKVTAQEQELPKGRMVIDKTVLGGGSLAGFQFEVRNSSNTLVGTYTTDSSGRISIPDLPVGTYTIREINIPAGYVLQGSNPKTLPVWANEATGIDFVNVRQQGKITVRKTNSDPNMGDYSLAGAVFEIWNTSGTVLYATITTNAAGVATSDDLNLGSYIVREKTAPEGFIRNPNDFPVTLSAGGTEVLVGTEVTVPNAPQTGRVTINKSNANPSMGSYSLAGAVFEIFDGNRNLVDTVTTNASGNAQSKTLKLGYYTIAEKTAPHGYVRNATDYVIHLAYAGQNVLLATSTLDVPEQPQVGVINVNKSNGNPAMGDYALSGAVFEVLNSGGTVVDTITTNASGFAQSKQLPLGSYQVREKTAPIGFIRNPGIFDVSLTYAGQNVAVTTASVNVVEQPQPGRINIRKTNSNAAMGDYSLAGAVFDIYSGSTIVDTVTTDASGQAQSRLLKLGSYTVKERTAPYGFVRNADTFTADLIYAGQDVECAYATVNCPERPQTGIIRLTKTNINPSMGDYALTGAVFEVRNAAGTLVDTITTNASGRAQTKELPLGAYRVTEKTAPYGFTRNKDTFNVSLVYAGQDVEITYGDVAVPQRPQTGKITVTKRDVVTGDIAQGDATLNGAVFEILAADQSTVLDTIYCGATDKATSKELPLGTYYIKEKVPPVGYTMDTAAHRIVIAYGDQDIEVLMLDGTVRNKVIEGQIGIVKHTDLPMEGYDDPQIEQPLADAKFEIFLKSSGSYANAKASERDLLVTNENGYALSKKLPYGLYTIKEIEAPGDVKLVDPFDVFISREGHIYRFILNDPTYNARVKIVKMDETTGKVIPAAGTSFKVKNLKTGEWVKQAVWYPTPATIDVYETGPDGTLVMPEVLYSGDYELHEVQAPYGYLLSATPVKFVINSEQQEAIVTVTMKNLPVMGKITVEKQGEMLVDAVEINTKFGKLLMPIFELRPLVGAEFDIIAADDIVTPDGTVRAKKGEVVDKLTTGDAGTATSKELFLGNYLAVETKAPTDFVLDPTPHPVSLVYEDQHTAIVTSQIGVADARQKVEILLEKVMEKPVGAPDDYSAFQDVVFGLFAVEDFGDIIPQDALIATITLDENGKGRFEGDLPFGKFYVKELQTNPFYQLNDMVFAIDVPYAGQDEAVSKVHVNNGGAIPNELKQGRIVIEKRGEVFVRASLSESGYTPIYELRGIPGATFEIITAEDIYDVFGKLIIKKGTVVDTITTDEDGRAESQPLRLGRYEIVETVAPVGFILDTKRHAVTLDFNGQVEEVVTKQITALNERYRAEIRIKKLWEVPANAPKDFAPWKDITFGLYAKDNVLAADGSVAIPAGALIETISIDENGNGKAKTDLPFGSYYLQELTTAEGYTLDDQRHGVLFAAGGEAVTVLSLSAENKIQRGSLRIIKTFEGRDTPIAGVPFTIVGQTAFGEVRMEAKTDKDGMILLDNLPVGKYTVTELDSELTKGYVLSPAQTIAVAGGKIAEMTINNKLQRGSLKVIKTFEGRTTPIEGVPFMIVGQTAMGEIRRQATTDKNGEILLENLPVGVYTVTEMRSNLTAGYVLSPAQTVTVEAGKTAEVKIENKLWRGSLRIIKTFEGRDEPLEGVPFLVVGKTVNGEVRFEVKTDKNGEILLENLPVGTYTVTEQKADITASYILAPAQTVTITGGNETTLKITNQLAKGEIRVLKIDKETGEPLEGAMFGLYKDGKLIAQAQSGKDGYAIFKDVAYGEYEIKELSAPVGYNRSEDVLKAVVGKDGSVLLFEVTNERIPGEPVQPEEPEIPVGPDMPVPPQEPLPKTGDSKTIVVIALVVLILAGGALLWLRKRGKAEDEPAEEANA